MNALVRSVINHGSQGPLILLSYAQENTSSQYLAGDVTKDIAGQFLQCAHVNPGGTCLCVGPVTHRMVHSFWH